MRCFRLKLKSVSTIQSDNTARAPLTDKTLPQMNLTHFFVSKPLHICCVSSESKQQLMQQKGVRFVHAESQERLQGEVRKKRRMFPHVFFFPDLIFTLG